MELASTLPTPLVLLLVHHLLLAMMESLAPLILALAVDVTTLLQPAFVAAQLLLLVSLPTICLVMLLLVSTLAALASSAAIRTSLVPPRVSVTMVNRVVVMMVMLVPTISARMVSASMLISPVAVELSPIVLLPRVVSLQLVLQMFANTLCPVELQLIPLAAV